jgi:hypothetical protein
MKRSKMKLSVIGLIMLFLLAGKDATMNAQIFDKGTIAVNAGIGVISTIRYFPGVSVSRTPVFAFSGEYGIMKLGPGVIGGGIAFGFQTASYTQDYYSYFYKYKWSTTMFGLRATYHPDFLRGEKYELYGIVQLSINHYGYTFTTNDPFLNSYIYGDHSLNTSFHPYLMVGAKYYFTKNFGVYSELGYDISLIKIGLTLKFDPKK